MAGPILPDERLSAQVRGDVQGVGFRFFAMHRARALGLRGYVRNQRDGSVEVVAEGPRFQLEQLLAALRRGPIGAAVSEVVATWSSAGETPLVGFTIRH